MDTVVLSFRDRKRRTFTCRNALHTQFTHSRQPSPYRAFQVFFVDHECRRINPVIRIILYRRDYRIIFQHLHLPYRINFDSENHCQSPRDGWKLQLKRSSSRCTEFRKQHWWSRRRHIVIFTAPVLKTFVSTTS